MTVAVRIGHCNETVPKNLIVTISDRKTGTIVQQFPIGPGIERVVTLHDAVQINIIEMDTFEGEPDGEE